MRPEFLTPLSVQNMKSKRDTMKESWHDMNILIRTSRFGPLSPALRFCDIGEVENCDFWAAGCVGLEMVLYTGVKTRVWRVMKFIA
jgi:hypothetical protein